jgi:PII-like signaling protein
MQTGQAKLLRIFVGEIDKIGHRPLYEAMVLEARSHGIAGATVLRGIMGYGASTRIHTAKLIDISEDLPIVIEIVDEEEKINNFIQVANTLMEECGRGGLITIEQVNVLYYEHKKK